MTVELVGWMEERERKERGEPELVE